MSARALLGAALLALMLAGPVAAETTPHDVVRATADTIAERLSGRKDYLAEHPDELYRLIDEILLPNFDTRYAGYIVLGKHWRRISDAQRTRFIEVFYEFLMRSYAKGILEFDPDNITIEPPRGEPGEKRAVVRTEMRLDDGTVVPVDYSLRNTKEGWKVFDVKIEGVSYVLNYRSQFDAEISATGIDAVIARLARETAELEAAERAGAGAESGAGG